MEKLLTGLILLGVLSVSTFAGELKTSTPSGKVTKISGHIENTNCVDLVTVGETDVFYMKLSMENDSVPGGSIRYRIEEEAFYADNKKNIKVKLASGEMLKIGSWEIDNSSSRICRPTDAYPRNLIEITLDSEFELNMEISKLKSNCNNFTRGFSGDRYLKVSADIHLIDINNQTSEQVGTVDQSIDLEESCKNLQSILSGILNRIPSIMPYAGG
ncbi:MAG: hypothetical protein ACJAS4_003832 [Bacteriovoracaceae bacterium]|jgi:hypothetical protein